MRLLTLDEVADMLRIPPSTLRYWRHRGDGPRGFTVGRRVVFKEDDVLAWIDEQQADKDPAPAAS